MKAQEPISQLPKNKLQSEEKNPTPKILKEKGFNSLAYYAQKARDKEIEKLRMEQWDSQIRFNKLVMERFKIEDKIDLLYSIEIIILSTILILHFIFG